MEISFYEKIKRAYVDGCYGQVKPEVAEILFRQKSDKMELVICRKEKEPEVHPAALGYMMEDELSKEWQLNAKDPIELNANRFLYGHTPEFLSYIGILDADADPTDQSASQTLAVEILSRKPELSEAGAEVVVSLEHNQASLCNFLESDDALASFEVKPTECGLNIMEIQPR